MYTWDPQEHNSNNSYCSWLKLNSGWRGMSAASQALNSVLQIYITVMNTAEIRLIFTENTCDLKRLQNCQ